MSDILFYNKKYIFGFPPNFWHRAPKTLGLSEGIKAIKVSFVMLIN